MTVLDSSVLQQDIGRRAVDQARILKQSNIIPTLAVVVSTPDPKSIAYAQGLTYFGKRVGIKVHHRVLHPPESKQLPDVVQSLAEDYSVHGVLCLVPLPDGYGLREIGELIPPSKDVDGINPTSLGRIAMGMAGFAPTTAQAVIDLLHHHTIPLTGAVVTVISWATAIDIALSILLTRANATVITCPPNSEYLHHYTTVSNIVISHADTPGLLDTRHIQHGAVVIDAGSSVTHNGQIVGDAYTEDIATIARITPVPHGVGPVTTAMRLFNTVTAATEQSRRWRR